MLDMDISNVEILACGGIGEIIMGGLGLIGSLIGGKGGQGNAPAAPASPGTEAVDPRAAAEKLRKEQAAAQRNSTTTVGTGLGSGSNDSNSSLVTSLGGA